MMCMFTSKARLQGINGSLFDKLCEPLSLSPNETRDSSTSATRMEHYFANLKGSSIFEEALLKIVGLEMEAFAAGQPLDIVLIEQTASFKLIQELVATLEAMQPNDPHLMEGVSFTT